MEQPHSAKKYARSSFEDFLSGRLFRSAMFTHLWSIHLQGFRCLDAFLGPSGRLLVEAADRRVHRFADCRIRASHRPSLLGPFGRSELSPRTLRKKSKQNVRIRISTLQHLDGRGALKQSISMDTGLFRRRRGYHLHFMETSLAIETAPLADIVCHGKVPSIGACRAFGLPVRPVAPRRHGWPDSASGMGMGKWPNAMSTIMAFFPLRRAVSEGRRRLETAPRTPMDLRGRLLDSIGRHRISTVHLSICSSSSFAPNSVHDPARWRLRTPDPILPTTCANVLSATDEE